MAKVYHEKKQSEKIIEGAIAGLIGGVVTALLLMLRDLVFLGAGAFYNVFSQIGSLVSGAPGTRAPIGLAIFLILFALIGYGFSMYKPIFRKFNINPILGGAIYGLLIGVLVFGLSIGSLRPVYNGWTGFLLALVAFVIGGVAMGYWTSRPQVSN